MSSLFELMMLWLLLAACVAMVVLSARARRLERDEGLASSQERLIAVSVVCAVVALLVLGATASAVLPSRAPVSVDRPPPAEPADPLALAKRKELENRKIELYEEIARVNVEIDKLDPVEDAPDKEIAPPWRAFDVGPLAHFLVPIFVMLGTVALVALGDPKTLLGRRSFAARDENVEANDESLIALDRLSHLADIGQFREGLQVAGTVEAGRLETFDRLDWAFLKSYCAVQLAMTETSKDGEHKVLLETAVRDLETLLEQAPNRGEAVYLLATGHGLIGERAKALAGFGKAVELLPSQAAKLPIAHNESVCLLGLAEDALGRGDAEGASRLFDQVTKRGVLVDQIPTSLVKVRLLNVRKSLLDGNHAEATKGIAALRTLEGLDAERRRDLEAICDAIETLMTVREGDPPAILKLTDQFLARHLPPGLPEPDEEIVEEYLESPAAGLKPRLSPEIFRAFLFLQAEAQSKIVAKSGVPPTEAQVSSITRPLFRALQFELRQRDILATLGGVYYWFVPNGRKKALQWLDAAASLGVEGRIARRLLEQARALELEHVEAMEWFRSTSIRFLHDPTVTTHVRKALIEELGRFQEFQPLLLDLDSGPELEPREPTLRLIRERAGYLDKMVADLAERKSGEIGPQLHELRNDYKQLITSLDASTGRMAEIERKLVQEVGKIVIS